MIKDKWAKLDKSVQKWATRLGAIATIIGFLVAGGGWVIHQVDNAVATRIENQTNSIQSEVKKLSDKVDSQDKEFELQLTRLELMMLMETSPDNIVEIEKVAYHYFQVLKGNTYMTSEYSKWCRAYGGNCDIMIK